MSNRIDSPATETKTENQAIIEAALRPIGKASGKFWLAIALLSAVVAVGIAAYVVQLKQGMGVAGYSDQSFWAIYIADVVTFIGFSYGGAVVSAILLLTGASWRAPLARMSEGMALVTVLIGAAFIFPHLGRPDRVLGMITSPNLASPIFWDFIAISIYTIATFVFFLLPLVPDTAILRSTHPDQLGRGRRFLYRLISREWVGSTRQRKVLHSAILIVAIVIIPLAVSVHSVLAWAFALVSRPGWHESIWAPYFVIAALYSGVALAILVVAGFRRGYHLEAFITERHFVGLGFIMATLGSVYVYLTFADLLPSAYVSDRGGANEIIYSTLLGDMAIWFWLFIVAGTILPILLVALPWTRNIWGMVTASVLVVIAMWLKRLIMVITTAGYDRLTGTFGDIFTFTWVSAAITLAGVAAIPLLLMLLFRVVPLLSIDEMQSLTEESVASKAPRPSERKASTGRATGVVGGAVVLMISLGAIGVWQAPPASAADSPAPATIEVTAVAKGPDVVVTALLEADGKPVPDAPVSFYESTSMFAPGDNLIPLGKVQTDPSGKAEVTYVAAVTGSRTISVTYFADVEGNPTEASTPITVNEAISPYVPVPPRPLDGVGETLAISLLILVFVVLLIVIAQAVRVVRVCRPASAAAADAKLPD
ncbi:NrfD/PsrC family molybdoenzyme membrane anchor subunit [Aeromicrobium sp.]